MGVLENKSRARLFYKYLSKVYDQINPYIWNEEMRDDALESSNPPDDRSSMSAVAPRSPTDGGLEHVDTGPGSTRAPTSSRRLPRSTGNSATYATTSVTPNDSRSKTTVSTRCAPRGQSSTGPIPSRVAGVAD